jgi:hypothetical protein
MRLIEAGIIAAHQMRPNGRWWISSTALGVYVEGLQEQSGAFHDAAGRFTK